MHTRESEEQFEGRISEHRKILYKVCSVYCADRDQREDLAQEILVQLWRSFRSFDGRCMFSTWMYRVALNTALSFSQRERRRKQHVVAVEERVLLDCPAREVERDEIRMLYELIAGLDPLSKALMLLYLDGNSYQEMADVLGISVTNVATKINRLKVSMKQHVAANVQTGKEETYDHAG